MGQGPPCSGRRSGVGAPDRVGKTWTARRGAGGPHAREEVGVGAPDRVWETQAWSDTLPTCASSWSRCFPSSSPGPLDIGIVGRAVSEGVVSVETVDLRAHGIGAYRQVDDAPVWRQAGMVMMIGPLAAALEPLADTHRVLLSPVGAPLVQTTLDRWAGLEVLTLVCGRYEGIDERVAAHLIDEEVSLGDFVLAGGEAAALAIIEEVVRLIPGVVGNPESTEHEFPHRGSARGAAGTPGPPSFRVGGCQKSCSPGDHGRIAAWRHAERLRRTRSGDPICSLRHDFREGESGG